MKNVSRTSSRWYSNVWKSSVLLYPTPDAGYVLGHISVFVTLNIDEHKYHNTGTNQMAERLDDETIRAQLETLEGWSIKNGKLHREYDFENFAQTRAFVERVCDVADEHNHHPEVWFTYSKAIVEITTHDAGGLTEKDVLLARALHRA